MEVVILSALAVIAAFAFLMKRGVKAVQAYVYLASRLDGKSETEANDAALRLDSHSSGHLNDAMRLFCKHCYGGRQLAMISSARLDGFKG